MALLGMKFEWDKGTGIVRLSQRHYFEEMLTEFGLQNIRSRITPLPVGTDLSSEMSPSTDEEWHEMLDIPFKAVLGKLGWAAAQTRPDISYAVSMLGHFQANPGLQHWHAMLHVVGYIKNTLDYSLTYTPLPTGVSPKDWVKPVGYVDADFGACKDTRRSVGGYVFTAAGAPVSWSSKRQAVVTLSTVGAEYVALSKAGEQAMWMRSWFDEVGFYQGMLRVYCDNLGATQLISNTKQHHKIKHIDMRYHFIRELAHQKELDIVHIPGMDNPADIFTKALPRMIINKHLATLGVIQ